MPDDGIGNGSGRQFQQGSLHIFRAIDGGAMLFQPFHMEIIASRAFGRAELEKRMVEQCMQEFWDRCTAGRPRTILVVGKSEMSLNPAIHQQIARPAIETDYVSRAQIGHIADTANIQDDAMNSRVAENSIVEGRNQGGALPAGSDIPAAEIGDDGNAGEFCEHRRIPDLYRVSLFGAVAYGLTMAANGGNAAGVEPSLGEKPVDAFGVDLGQGIGSQMAAFDFMISAGIQREQFVF